MVGPPLGTRGPHGGPDLHPSDRPGGPPTRLAGTPPNHPWEALYTALYWAQGSPHAPDTRESTEAWVMQAKTMRNYHLHHPFDDSPPNAMAYTTPGDHTEAR